jgi:hypothetical protein
MKAEVGPTADRVEAGTFHHFCLKMMRRMPRKFGTENAVDLVDKLLLPQ